MFKFNFDIEEADTEALNNLSLDEKPNTDQKGQPASLEQAALAAYKSHTVAELVDISFYSARNLLETNHIVGILLHHRCHNPRLHKVDIS